MHHFLQVRLAANIPCVDRLETLSPFTPPPRAKAQLSYIQQTTEKAEGRSQYGCGPLLVFSRS